MTFELKRRDLNLMFLATVPIIFIILAFIFARPAEIIKGLHRIVTFPDVLLIDYLAIGGPGATFFNAGSLALIAIFFVWRFEVPITSSIISAILTLTGFAFIGKNIVNVWPIFLGGYIYAKFTQSPIKDVLAVVLFSTTLSPAVSYLLFGFDLPIYIGIPAAIFVGIVIGFVVVPLSKHLIHSHAGYNIYNIGFVGGLIGIVIASVMRGFGLETTIQYIVTSEYSIFLRNLLILIFIFFIFIGYIKNGRSFRGYGNVFKYSGRLLSTFIEELGYGIAYINIGVMGLLCISYVMFVGGTFNGPVIAAVFTAAGFSPSGKNPANTIPVLIGVYLTTILKAFDVSSTSIVIAALFSTTLAPIAGVYGIIPGIIAGFLHLCISPNLSTVHAGLHLYNNGFSGGIVAMVMAPILETFFDKNEDIF